MSEIDIRHFQSAIQDNVATIAQWTTNCYNDNPSRSLLFFHRVSGLLKNIIEITERSCSFEVYYLEEEKDKYLGTHAIVIQKRLS